MLSGDRVLQLLEEEGGGGGRRRRREEEEGGGGGRRRREEEGGRREEEGGGGRRREEEGGGGRRREEEGGGGGAPKKVKHIVRHRSKIGIIILHCCEVLRRTEIISSWDIRIDLLGGLIQELFAWARAHDWAWALLKAQFWMSDTQWMSYKRHECQVHQATLSPEPETPNPKPQTLNPKP